jgi:hypothetical protein
MAFRLDEIDESRSSTYDEPTETRVYRATGEFDDQLVRYYALAATPPSIFTPQGQLFRQDLRVDPDGWSRYLIRVPYARRKKQSGDWTWDFDTTGATVKIRCAKEHVKSYPDDGDWHKSAIGVKGDGEVEGVEIVTPALKINATYSHPLGLVTIQYARVLAAATGRTNSVAFMEHDVGELLFLGASGSDGTSADAKVTYHFASSANVTDLNFGDIAAITKKGHDYAWVEFKDEVESGEAVRQPKRAHIERVYDGANFPAIFGWS